jgi:uncharacterized protein
MRALLDVNVLLALLDQDHVHHERAREWLKAEQTVGWASCAITQNGFIRIISRLSYPNPITASAAMGLLRAATQTIHHEFWPCAVSVLDQTMVADAQVHGHRQVTDIYLLALAVHSGGRLVTFDQSVLRGAVPKASAEHLIVI